MNSNNSPEAISSKLESSRTQLLTGLVHTIFELAKIEHDQHNLEQLKVIAAEAASLFESAERELHPDLGLNLTEFVMLRLDDVSKGGEQKITGASTQAYEDNVQSMLDEIINRQGFGK